MFALSPLSGRLAERLGRVRTIVLGTAILALSSVMAAAAPPAGGNLLLVALFLLGFGWNLGFVAGSALLSEHLELHERTRVQGVADALIWSTSAAASLGSGLIMAVAGYTALGILGVGLVVIPIVTLQTHRSALAHHHAAPEPAIPEPDGRGPRTAPGPYAGRGSRTTQLASTRAHATTSSTGTYSSALWATAT
jgi:MFS family permease